MIVKDGKIPELEALLEKVQIKEITLSAESYDRLASEARTSNHVWTACSTVLTYLDLSTIVVIRKEQTKEKPVSY